MDVYSSVSKHFIANYFFKTISLKNCTTLWKSPFQHQATQEFHKTAEKPNQTFEW